VSPEELRSQGLHALTGERCAELLVPYARLGVHDFLLMERMPADERTIELLARSVAPAVRAALR